MGTFRYFKIKNLMTTTRTTDQNIIPRIGRELEHAGRNIVANTEPVGPTRRGLRAFDPLCRPPRRELYFRGGEWLVRPASRSLRIDLVTLRVTALPLFGNLAGGENRSYFTRVR